MISAKSPETGPGGAPLAPLLSSQIPSLDGLRAVSIVLVLISHLDGVAGFPLRIGGLLGDTGNLGVRVFFVISGFLITTLLLKEFVKTGGISLKRFYLRRTFRIFPAFYAYTLVLAAAALLGWVEFLPGDLLHAVSYSMNYHFPHSWWLAHIWSLSVEEQFYLLWPALLVIFGTARGLWLSGFALVAVPVLRILTWWLLPAYIDQASEQFHTVSDALATGCFLACSFNLLGRSERYCRFLRSRWFILVPLVGLLMHASKGSTRFYFLAGITVLNVAIALCVDRFVRYPERDFGAVLNSAPMCYAGRLSYSIYLWQQPFLNRHSSAMVAAFPVNLALVAACALASYYLVEQPIRKYGHRLMERPAVREAAA